jgi:hypothetical protein
MAEHTQVITAARSICWEEIGESTIFLTDVQCLIRAAVAVERRNHSVKSSEEAEGFLDLAEELSDEYD